MENVTVQTENVTYPIYVKTSFDGLPHAMAEAGLSHRKYCIVTDSQVAPLYLGVVANALSSVANGVVTVQFETGELQKHLKTVSHFYDAFLANTLDRSSVIVALGGGVTGDMAGFAAATYMRGVPFVQIPTTLLAQVDASVGGKTAVDHNGVKNLVGVFYQPKFVYINTIVLQTLSDNDFRSGLGEAIKHGLIGDAAYYHFLRTNKKEILSRETDALQEVVSGSCRIKAAVVSQDEKETQSGVREILNLGHTFGHAVESLTGYTLPHGCCVGIGMCAALYLSYKLGNINRELLIETESMLTYYGLPTRAPELDPAAVYQKMLTDKKTQRDTLRLVLLKRRGEAYTDGAVPKTLVMESIVYMIAGDGL